MIPKELQDLDQWHNWTDSNGTKIPIQANGQPAKSNDPSTWTDYWIAMAAGALAFEITAPYTGIDLDNCLDGRSLRDWAVPIVDALRGVAYAEISPSRTGIKFLTRARKREGARCVHKFGGDKQQLECYDKTRFWTITGELFDGQDTIADGQEAIDWICKTYLEIEKVERRTVISIESTSLVERANNYLNAAGPAAKGERNIKAFSVAGHLVAIEGEDGQRLDGNQLVELMASWNDRNPEPLPESELARVVKSAQQNGTPRQPKVPEIKVHDTEGTDITGILMQEPKSLDLSAPKTTLPDPTEIDEIEGFRIRIDGLISDLVEYNLKTAHYPLDELALAGAIALMSTVTSGKVKFGGCRSNLYVMGLAPSGGGKDYSRKLNRKILRAAGHGEACGPERIGSHAGIISAMAENWRTLFQIDEIGRLLATTSNASMNPHLYNISSVLMQIYSSADDVWQGDAYGDRKKVKTLNYPHCVVYGSSIPAGFWEGISKESLTNGLIGRFLVFENPNYVDYQVPATDSIPSSIVECATEWMNLKTHSGNLSGSTESEGAHAQEVYADEQASERLHQHAIDISNKRKAEPEIQAAVWSRHAEKTNKLALLFACSRWRDGKPWPTIRISDADNAIMLNNLLTRRMLIRSSKWVAENQVERDSLKVLRIIEDQPGITMGQLARQLRHLTAKNRRDILNDLQESGDVVCELVETGGRSRREYRAL